MDTLILIANIVIAILSIILFFKIWAMCDDVRAMKKYIVKDSPKQEVENIDEWLKGGDGMDKEVREDMLYVGASVSSVIERETVKQGDILVITKRIDKDTFICSKDGKEVGKFSSDEIFRLR